MKERYVTSEEDQECTALLSPAEGNNATWLLADIRTKPRYRSQGHAHRLMKQIVSDANREDVILLLRAEADTWDNRVRPGLTQAQLMGWFEHWGFHHYRRYDPFSMRR
jgi:GNAT superfamily N-acetyltransferase